MSPAIQYARRIAAIHEELGIPADYSLRRRLDIQPEAEALVSIGKDTAGRDCRLTELAAHAWKRLRLHAEEHGVELLPISGFRSVDRQTEIIRGKLALGEPIASVLQTMAAPGYSEHHSGRALDVGTPDSLPLEECFADTRAFAWLERHAGECGFQLSFPRGNPYQFIYEPWHWCWHPPASSTLAK